MENITVRPIKEEDYVLINSWWKSIGKSPPPRKLLPDFGLHGGSPSYCKYLKVKNYERKEN